MTQVTREPLAAQAARLLGERIRGGEWAIGEKLPGETALAAQLDVGRSTVREAIGQLAGRGILQARQGSGVFVRALDTPEGWDDLIRTADIAAVVEARVAIEVEAAALAAERCSEASLTRIRAALATRARLGTETSGTGIAELVAADIALHRSIVAAAENPILLEVFDGCTARVERTMTAMLTRAGRGDEVADQRVHSDLVAAIAAHDVPLATALARAHLVSMRQALM